MMQRLPDIFSKNRSEETREDNWLDFVVPPFLNDLSIKSQTKAVVIVGGRGCGKTTLLRYFCHATQFSPKRQSLPEDLLSHIGLYWRADTNFLNSFVGGGQTPEVWRAAFEHLLACELGKEIIHALYNLNCNPSRNAKFGKLDELDLSDLRDFDPLFGSTLAEVERELKKSRRKISTWVNNLGNENYKPTFLPADLFLKTLLELLQEQLPYLSSSTFAVFIDEYENLRDEQQYFVNGLLKHGARPLIYNIAMKRNGWHTQQTTGSERLQYIADYNEIDLEDKLSEHFDLFAAELLFFRLADKAPHLFEKIPIVPECLRSVEHISDRYNDEEYKIKVISAAEQILPRINERSAACEILKEPRLRSRLLTKISNALEKRHCKLQASEFIDDSFPEASVIMPALISRPREEPVRLLGEFNEFKTLGDKGNRFNPGSALLQNNLFGCVNSIYMDQNRASVLFSGFTSITLMSKGNIRYLLELIHRIFKAFEHSCFDEIKGELPVVPGDIQAKAIQEASESIIGTVSGHGVHGPQLYSLAQCLGSIFRERHRNERQSEPEINHFTISKGDINEELSNYLQEAVKWSVLFSTKETKMKSAGAINFDYVLNPIFSAFFQISFRKKRSLPVTASQLKIMLEGDQAARDYLVREIGRHDASEHPSLFGESL